MKPWLGKTLGVALVTSGLVAIAAGGAYTSTMRTVGGQVHSDVSIGLASSPFYVFHKREPVGGADLAITRGEPVQVVIERGTRWLSWSALLLVAGLSAITYGLLLLVRKPKDAPGPPPR